MDARLRVERMRYRVSAAAEALDCSPSWIAIDIGRDTDATLAVLQEQVALLTGITEWVDAGAPRGVRMIDRPVVQMGLADRVPPARLSAQGVRDTRQLRDVILAHRREVMRQFEEHLMATIVEVPLQVLVELLDPDNDQYFDLRV